jgi:hypothetical protein
MFSSFMGRHRPEAISTKGMKTNVLKAGLIVNGDLWLGDSTIAPTVV